MAFLNPATQEVSQSQFGANATPPQSPFPSSFGQNLPTFENTFGAAGSPTNLIERSRIEREGIPGLQGNALLGGGIGAGLGSRFPSPETGGASPVSFPGVDSSISRSSGGPQATLAAGNQQFSSSLAELLQMFQQALGQQQQGGAPLVGPAGSSPGSLLSGLMQSLQTSGQFGGFGSLLGSGAGAAGGQLAARPAFRSELDRLGVNRL